MSIGISLSLESNAFNGFKQDFKTILNNTFETMQEKDVDKATVTAKFEIALIPGINPNTDAPDSAAERSFVAPMIKHKITANMKLQSEKAGVLGGPDWELVWDRSSGTFAMVPVKGDQASMFDDAYEYEEDDL